MMAPFVALLVIFFAFFVQPASGQMNCAPTELVMTNLESQGWQIYEVIPVPNGSAIAFMCNGSIGGLVAMSPDGTTCLIGQPISELCRLPGTESRFDARILD